MHSTTMAFTIFWLAIGVMFYAYVGYPILIAFLRLIIRNPVRIDNNHEPNVTLLITVYNEERAIAKKLENALSLDYPHDKLQIIVASDGSTDRTEGIAREYAERYAIIRVIRVEGRVGKTETQNRAIASATGEIVLFSDATTDYKSDSIRKIVRNYADPTVGAVSGRYHYVTEDRSAMGLGSVMFWDYENFIKSCQTNIRTVTGCCGCIYSVRTALYVPLRRDIISDLVEPLKIIENGYRVAFEEEAVAYEGTTERASDEMRMRIRVITRGINGVVHMRRLLNPIKYGFVALQLLSHKVLRWFVPVLMVSLFVSNVFLLGPVFYDLMFAVQIALYASAAVGWVSEKLGLRARILSLPLYFCVVNIACVAGLWNVVRGEKRAVWETARGA